MFFFMLTWTYNFPGKLYLIVAIAIYTKTPQIKWEHVFSSIIYAIHYSGVKRASSRLKSLETRYQWENLNILADYEQTVNYKNCGLRMHRACWERPQRVSDPDMHHGTCATHVPGCMLGSLTSGFLWSRWLKNVPGIPGACATQNFTYLARGPWQHKGPHGILDRWQLHCFLSSLFRLITTIALEAPHY